MFVNPNDYAYLQDDAQMIQAAVDAAIEKGKSVMIPAFNERTGKKIWILDRAVKLHSGSVICLHNCHLRLAEQAFDNIFKNDTARTEAALRVENRTYDVHIYGVGNAVLDGGDHNGLVERNSISAKNPTMPMGPLGNILPYRAIVNTAIHFHNAERIRIENIRIVNARYWGMTFHYCSSVRISNIHFMSGGGCPNNDGIDVRTGCCDFTIENITGYTQDDSIALTCMRDGELYDVEGLDQSVHGIMIRNVATCTRCANVRLLNHFGRKLYNIIIENVQSSVETDPCEQANYTLRLPDAEQVKPALKKPYWDTFADGKRRAQTVIRIGDNKYFDQTDPDTKAKFGDTHDIMIRNVQGYAQYGVTVSCTLCDSIIENVQMFGENAIAMYFGEGRYANIRTRDIGFSSHSKLLEEDKQMESGFYPYHETAAVYFHDAQAEAMFFDGVTAHPAGQPAFAGCGQVRGQARGVLVRGEFPVIEGELDIEV